MLQSVWGSSNGGDDIGVQRGRRVTSVSGAVQFMIMIIIIIIVGEGGCIVGGHPTRSFVMRSRHSRPRILMAVIGSQSVDGFGTARHLD